MNLSRESNPPCPKCGSEASEHCQVITVANTLQVFTNLFCFFCNYTREEKETATRKL